MPNGDGWQGDVLRDLRSGAQQGAQGPSGQAYSASASRPELSSQGTQTPDAAHGGGAPQQAGYPYQGQEQQAPAAYAPGPQPQSAPGSRPVVDEGLAGALRSKPRHGESFAARATRALRRTLSSSAAREVAEITRTAAVLQQPVTTGRQIAITSIRGGSGKSTVAALLGTTYAHYRQDPVLFLEADPALGSLPLRLGAGSRRWTTSDIADIVKADMSLLDVTGYLVQLPDNAWLLPASQGQIGVMLDSRAYERAVVALRRYFGVMIIDCETLPAEVARVALAAAHGRVLTAPATPEGVTSTYAVLQWMQGLPRHVIAGTVVVLTELVPNSGLDLDAAAQGLKSTGASVQVLPYDRHLAAGGAVHTELLAHPTREAAARLAADVFQLSLSQKRH
ncbi:MinD/ParA family ATP-binding protein [Streptomyces halobius]|uniref:MinD/ParA family protein n=1 Tax=Streptomyces halobius TaxID=2879846 RepID=A0ABY4MGL2_9ACTN|nr:MinD/ParA family protein [Streptomyces halobius]UQA96648.1 MinD/ParA family protein [Streptomyces halobius]